MRPGGESFGWHQICPNTGAWNGATACPRARLVSAATEQVSPDSPLSMFEPSTWAMAFLDLFPWGDGVPFLRREVPLAAEEVFQYLLLREELEYEVDGADETPASRRRVSADSNASVRDIKASSRWTASVSRHVLVAGECDT